jgi:hypothetical protein
VDFLRGRGVRKLDGIVVSNPDDERILGHLLLVPQPFVDAPR